MNLTVNIINNIVQPQLFFFFSDMGSIFEILDFDDDNAFFFSFFSERKKKKMNDDDSPYKFTCVFFIIFLSFFFHTSKIDINDDDLPYKYTYIKKNRVLSIKVEAKHYY